MGNTSPSDTNTMYETEDFLSHNVDRSSKQISQKYFEKTLNEDCRHKIVFGYIHDLENSILSNEYPIPSDIIMLCLSYYLLGESFNEKVHGKNIKLISSNKAILNLSNTSSLCGTAVVDIKSNPHSIFVWTIKLHANGPSKCQLGIGIISISDKLHKILNSNCFSHDKCSYYSLYTTTGFCTLDSSNYSCKTRGFNAGAKLVYNADDVKDNIIKMELNIKNQTIKYYINGCDYGIAYSQIDLTQKYYFGACLYQKNTIIEIIDFQIKE